MTKEQRGFLGSTDILRPDHASYIFIQILENPPIHTVNRVHTSYLYIVLYVSISPLNWKKTSKHWNLILQQREPSNHGIAIK